MSTTNRENMESIKHRYEERLNQSLVKFKSHYEIVMNEKEAELKIRLDKPVQKFEDWV
jgi:hypothetical protein